MRILLIVFLSFFAFSDDHDEMYQPGWAEYVYCNVKEGLTDSKATKMFEKRRAAYAEIAEGLDDEVGMVVLFPYYTNEEMRDGADLFFVTHAPTMKALGEHSMAMFAATQENPLPASPLECDNASTAFQRIGPSSGEVTDSFMVDYYPCKYKEGADPVAMRALQAEFAMEHYANGAQGGYRYIYPTAGSPRGDGPDFWFSGSSPTLATRGESSDIFWDKSYGSEAERARWDHMTCDTNSTWYGERVYN